MTPLAWTAAAFTALLALAALAITAADVALVRAGQASISERLLAAARQHPIVPALVAGGLCFLLGLLLGHLFLPQRG